MKAILIAAAVALSTAGAASAHHAFSMYDNAKYTPLTGTVKTFSWQNPHAMLSFVTTTGEEWSIECSSPNIIGRKGWSATSLKAGDKVSLQIHPMKDGSRNALMVTVTTPSGEVLKDKS